MASVYRATDTRLHVERAVKILAPEMARSAKIMERFDREARVMAQLEHPNVVPVHDVGRDGDIVYLVMSLFHDGSLDDQLEEHGALPPRDAVQATLGVVHALKAAHRKGVIHRDVKPQNVLIDPHGHPRLCDFGIAHVSTDPSLTGTGAQLGTWAFMAPEQRAGQPIDGRIDVYAVGAMLFMLVTNEVPNELHAAEAHDGQFGGVPDALRALIVRATRFRPADRHPDMEALQADLEQLLTALPYTKPIRLGSTPKPLQREHTNQTLVGWDGDPPPTEGPFADGSLTKESPHGQATAWVDSQTTSSGWVARGVGVAAVGSVFLTVMAVVVAIAGWAVWSNTSGQASTVDETQIPAAPAPLPAADPLTPAADPSPTPQPSVPPIQDAEPQPVVSPQPVAQPQPVPQPQPELAAPVLAEPVPMAEVVEQPAEPEPRMDVAEPLPGYGVTITSIPWSTVTLDGTAKGTTLWTDELPSGPYTVRLQAAGYPDLVRVVTVADGPLAFCWDFSERAVCAR
jgi:serine/threonine-protein kinase